jgi:ABC-2 type transport system permease protein
VTALRIPWAFLVRDARIELSYRTGLFQRVFLGVTGVTIFYFIAEVIRNRTSVHLAEYGGDYFGFAVIGLAVFSYMGYGLAGLPGSIRTGQASGVLELMVLGRAPRPILLLSAALPSFTFATLTLASFLLTAAAFGLDYGRADVPTALLAFVLAVGSYLGVTLLTASLVVVTERGNPIGWAVRAASMILAGVFWPIALLPAPLEALSQALPLTHALEALRRSLLLGEGVADLWVPLTILAGMAAVLVPAGLLACRLGFRLARTDGRLARY